MKTLFDVTEDVLNEVDLGPSVSIEKPVAKKKIKRDEPQTQPKEDKAAPSTEADDGGSEEKPDISDTGRIKKEIRFEYRIRDDFNHSAVGDSGEKFVVLDEENIGKIATTLWEEIVETIDYDFLSGKKKDTALKFYLEADFDIQSGATHSQTIRVFFDLVEEGQYKITGWTFNNIISNKESLEDLDEKLSGLLKSVYEV